MPFNTTMSTTVSMHGSTTEHAIIGLESLLFVLVVIITLFSSKLIDLFKLRHISESTVSIIFGLLIGILVTFFPKSYTKLFSFDSEFFFFALLPPIVFEAGFSLKRKHFFRNMSSILIFAILGTMISTVVIAVGLYILSWMNVIPLFNNGNPLECLLFGALISAVDPVGTLSVLGKKELNVDPMLYSLIFGESVLNDAVSIVLFKIFSDYSETQIVITFEAHFLSLLAQFFGIFIGSLLIGVIIALIASFILRHSPTLLQRQREMSESTAQHINLVETDDIDISNNQSPNDIKDDLHPDPSLSPKAAVIPVNNDDNDPSISINNNNNQKAPSSLLIDDDHMTISTNEYNLKTGKDVIYLDEYRASSGDNDEYPSLEFAIIILFSYLSYNIGEVLSLSGIVSVFSCGICMSHYAWYNLTWVSQASLHHVIRALSKCCENFVYAYLGISTSLSLAPSTAAFSWNIWLILCSFSLCILARACNIFPLSLIINIRRNTEISFPMQTMMFFSGLRGAIAFALALNLVSPHSKIIVTSTLSIVIITTVICGCTTDYMLHRLRLNNHYEIDENDDDYHVLRTNTNTTNNAVIKSYKGVRKLWHPKSYKGVHKLWHHFDHKYMMKWFGGSHDPKKNDHNLHNIGLYSERQQCNNATKNKENKDNDDNNNNNNVVQMFSTPPKSKQ